MISLTHDQSCVGWVRRLGRWQIIGLAAVGVAVGGESPAAGAASLELSVYCTAGDVNRCMTTPQAREQVLRVLQPLSVGRLFLEGRRGDQCVSPGQLSQVRDWFSAHGIRCSGGIATVPGANFGQRQQGGLDWLNWESRKSQADVAAFFTEEAPVFPELIVDDFYCTGDTSPEAEQARGTRSWGQYRRDLLVSLIDPLMVKPTRAARRQTRLILKFPQWYDRFQLYGYDPLRMPAHFDEIWVGTEVRDPETQRMGFVQPTEGYMNFRWLASQAGSKVRGAWFDHIECSAQNFVDQAYLSVLAGARELTLFSLNDVMSGHPGDALLGEKWTELCRLAERVHGKPGRGIFYYKPAGSDGSENLYLADNLGMIGLPILPVGSYPTDAAVAFLPVQAAADPKLLENMRRHLNRGASLVLTPALVRALGQEGARQAGVVTGPISESAVARAIRTESESVDLPAPLELDAALKAAGCRVHLSAELSEGRVPFLTSQVVGRGRVLVLNVRTFSDSDFGKEGEYLLAPKRLGLPRMPQLVADRIRSELLHPLHIDLCGPAGVAFVLFGKEACFYNFRGEAVQLEYQKRLVELAPHACRWSDGGIQIQ
jgi:hypothetical protein